MSTHPLGHLGPPGSSLAPALLQTKSPAYLHKTEIGRAIVDAGRRCRGILFVAPESGPAFPVPCLRCQSSRSQWARLEPGGPRAIRVSARTLDRRTAGAWCQSQLDVWVAHSTSNSPGASRAVWQESIAGGADPTLIPRAGTRDFRSRTPSEMKPSQMTECRPSPGSSQENQIGIR